MLNMLKNKKGAEMSLNVIIIAVICLIVLVVLIVIFAMNTGKFSFGTQDCASKGAGAMCSDTAGNCLEPDGTTIYGYAKIPGTSCKTSSLPNGVCCLPIKVPK